MWLTSTVSDSKFCKDWNDIKRPKCKERASNKAKVSASYFPYPDWIHTLYFVPHYLQTVFTLCSNRPVRSNTTLSPSFPPMNTPDMTLKLVLPREPSAAKFAPNHRTHEPANSIRTMLRAIMPHQIAPTFGDVLATLFEARELFLVAEMGLLVLEQCVGVAIRYRAVKTSGHPATGWQTAGVVGSRYRNGDWGFG